MIGDILKVLQEYIPERFLLSVDGLRPAGDQADSGELLCGGAVFSGAAWRLHPTTVQTRSSVGIHSKQTSPIVALAKPRGGELICLFPPIEKRVGMLFSPNKPDELRSPRDQIKFLLVLTRHSVLIESSGSD